jgi:transcriptional regulator with XRE-family HTH domain
VLTTLDPSIRHSQENFDDTYLNPSIEGPTLAAVEPEYQETLRQNLARAMSDKGWGTKDLAKALHYESDIHVRRWLRGQVTISIVSLSRIAAALETTPEALDTKREAYDPDNRPAHMRRGGNPRGRAPRSELLAQLDAAEASFRSRNLIESTPAPGADYLEAMALWWNELDAVDREKVHDYARQLRDARREVRRKAAG